MGQSGGPSSDGLVPSPRREEVEELMCSVMPVRQDVVRPSQTACGVDGVDLWETGPNNTTYCQLHSGRREP